jgi:hypothetical protein
MAASSGIISQGIGPPNTIALFILLGLGETPDETPPLAYITGPATAGPTYVSGPASTGPTYVHPQGG